MLDRYHLLTRARNLFITVMNQPSASMDATSAIASNQSNPPGSLAQIERDKDTSLKRMIEWLTQDPVRNTNSAHPGFGSFNHGVHGKTGHNPGQYTEITGYGVSLLSHLSRYHKDDKYLEAARHAADFLLSIQLDNGAYPHCPKPDASCANGEQFTFDTSMCTMGIMDLYAIDPQEKYAESAIRAGDWLLSMQREDGSFRAKFSAQTGHMNTGNFFGDGSCIHVKNAMALLKIAAGTGEERFDIGGRKVCDYTLKLQSDEGLFWSMPTKNFVFTHAHCYACEGFLSAGAYTGEQKYTDAALKGIHWLKKSQNSDGSVYQVYADQRGFKQRVRQSVDAFKAADASSQAARLFALAGAGFESNYREAISFVKNQMQSPDGGLYYTNGRFRTNYMMYAWPTMFAIQAIEFAHQSVTPKDLF